MDFLHFFYTSQAAYAMNENGLYFDRLAFLIFWGFFLYAPRKPRKLEIETPKIGGYVMLAQTSHILWNNIILSESLHNSFFFPHN